MFKNVKTLAIKHVIKPHFTGTNREYRMPDSYDKFGIVNLLVDPNLNHVAVTAAVAKTWRGF